MRDFLLVVPEDRTTSSWFLDINIVDGYPEVMHFEGQTQDQRAAVAAVMQRGTVPGMLEEGVDWTATLANDPKSTMITLDNQIKQNVNNLSARSDSSSGVTKYLPLYIQNKNGSIDVTLMRG